MKKILSLFSTLALVLTLTLSFAACTWDAAPGGPNSTPATPPADTNPIDTESNTEGETPAPQPSEEELAQADLDNKYEALSLILETNNDGTNIYTDASIALAKAEYAKYEGVDFEKQGLTLDQINDLIDKLDSCSALLVKAISVAEALSSINDRIEAALATMQGYYKFVDTGAGYKYLKSTAEDPDAELIIHANLKKESNTSQYYVINSSSASGVDYIDYNRETMKATFHLSYGACGSPATDTTEAVPGVALMNFLTTGVVALFQTGFADVCQVSFDAIVNPHINQYYDETKGEIIHVFDKNTTTTEKIVFSFPKGDGVMQIGAGVLCVTAGPDEDFMQALYESTFTEVLSFGGLTDETYSIIENKGCTADVTFNPVLDNGETYTVNNPFSVYFEAYQA